MTDQTNSRAVFYPQPQHYAAIYARKSNLGRSNSKESQVDLAKEILLQKGLLLYDVYDEDISATKYKSDSRAEFKRLMEDAEAGKFKNIIVFRSDRLARDSEDFIKIRNFCKKHSIKILYSNQNGYELPDDHIGHFMENVIMAVDQLEPQMISERIAVGKKKKRNRGEYSSGGHIPFGYIKIEKDDEGKEYIPKDEDHEANIIRDIFSKCLFLSSTYTIDDFISDINKTHKKKYSPSRMEVILTNPVYGGYLILDPKIKIDDVIVRDLPPTELPIDFKLLRECHNVEAILDRDTYFNAFIMWRSFYKRKPKKEDPLLKGLVYCKKCDKKIPFENGLYTCSRKACISIQEKSLLKKIYSAIVKDLVTSEFIEKNVSSKAETLGKELKKLKRRTTRLQCVQNYRFVDYINHTKENSYKEDFLKNYSRKKQCNEIIYKHEKDLLELEKVLNNIQAFRDDLVGLYNPVEYLLIKNDIVEELVIPMIEKIFIEKVDVHGKNQKIDVKIQYSGE